MNEDDYTTYANATFTAERETKNTIKFQEDVRPGSAPVIGSLYVQKSALPTPAPTSILVTISTKAD